MAEPARARGLDELIAMAAETARSWFDSDQPIPFLYGLTDDGTLEVCALALDLGTYAKVQDELYKITALRRHRAAVYVAEVWAAADRDLTPAQRAGVIDGSFRMDKLPAPREEVMLLAQDIEGNRRDLVMTIERRGNRRKKRKVYGDPTPLPGGRRYPFKLFAFRVTYAPKEPTVG